MAVLPSDSARRGAPISLETQKFLPGRPDFWPAASPLRDAIWRAAGVSRLVGFMRLGEMVPLAASMARAIFVVVVPQPCPHSTSAGGGRESNATRRRAMTEDHCAQTGCAGQVLVE